MSAVRDLHAQAMSLAEEAIAARQAGDFEHAEELARQAWPLESEAAARIKKEIGSEPTRSILYRSAASLAFQANDFGTAQRLVCEGLAGYPPPRVEQELKDLFDQINFANHLQVHGAALGGSDMQLALDGNVVGSGYVLFSEFQKRSEAVVGLLDRTMRRLLLQPYQKAGQAPEAFRPFQPVISTARVGSYAITLQLLPKLNQQLPLGVTGAGIIDEVLVGVDLVQRDRLDELQGRFEDERYYRNFVAGAKQLAPDGTRVNFVGLTTTTRVVSFTRPTEAIPPPPVWHADTAATRRPPETIRMHGVLDYASARNTDMVGLTTDDGKKQDLHVEEGLEDVVRSYFKRNVIVVATRHGDETTLVDVQGAE